MTLKSNFYVAHSTSAAGQEIYFIGVTSLLLVLVLLLIQIWLGAVLILITHNDVTNMSQAL